ncbi:hypothetical protein OG604_48625 [Streptomyces sp. NBC_01231]|nr:hypothetical protein OG604_48625 [Streptomyces sp. NBC_01231]
MGVAESTAAADRGTAHQRCQETARLSAGDGCCPAAELGYQVGGLRTALSSWPGSGRPWRPGLGPLELATEVVQMRTACWIVIAYLSGMGEEAEWVVLDVVHQAVALLAAVNDDPTHLFAHKGMTSNSLVLFGSVNRRLNDFRDHLNELFSAGFFVDMAQT